MGVFPVHLSFWRLPVVINPATVTKRLTISLLLCLLALAIVSNRLVSLRQIAMAADSGTNVHQPLDYMHPARIHWKVPGAGNSAG